jgi:hypothetical protein
MTLLASLKTKTLHSVDIKGLGRSAEAVCSGCNVMYLHSSQNRVHAWAQDHAAQCTAK